MCTNFGGLGLQAFEVAEGVGAFRHIAKAVSYTHLYALLSEKTGLEITGELDLMDILTELSSQQKEYARVKSAMEQVRATGYGIVMPDESELHLDKPEIIRKGSSYACLLYTSPCSFGD